MASASGETAQVLDASINGIRLSHSAQFAEQKRCEISIEWHGRPIAFVAERRWTNQVTGMFQSGFEIQTIDPAASTALRELIEECAKAMPHYERHELVYGVWRTMPTTDAWQPPVGFTVAASESSHTVAFFRTAYSTGDLKMRERIRKLAELTITHPRRLYEL